MHSLDRVNGHCHSYLQLTHGKPVKLLRPLNPVDSSFPRFFLKNKILESEFKERQIFHSTPQETTPQKKSNRLSVSHFKILTTGSLKMERLTHLNRAINIMNGKQKRECYSFGSNLTIARCCESGHSGACSPSSPTLTGIKPPVKPTYFESDRSLACRTQDHAQRRLQLLYYMMVAYYGEGCIIVREQTVLQHGRSHCSKCSAAHSSILPNVTDDFFENLQRNLRSKGYLDKVTKAKLISFGVKKKVLKQLSMKTISKKKWSDLFRDIGISGKLKLLSRHSQFYYNMNSTIELPHLVNDIDGMIEMRLREKAVRLLNLVSADKLSPYEGLECFVKELHICFNFLIDNTKVIETYIKSIYDTEKEIHQLEKEILTNCVVDKLNWLKRYFETVNKQQSTRKSLASLAKGPLNSLNHSMCSKTHEKIFKWMKKPTLECWKTGDSTDTLFDDEKNIPFIFEHLKSKIIDLPGWKLCPVEAHLTLLTHFLQIVEWQAQGSRPLSQELLSGKFKKGKLHLPTDDDLFLQKLEVIRRLP